MSDLKTNINSTDLLTAGKNLTKFNLSFIMDDLRIESIWCRFALLYLENYNKKPQKHSFYEIHICLDGLCRMKVGNKEYTLNKNHFLLIPPNTNHTITYIDDRYSQFIWGFRFETDSDSFQLYINKFEKLVKNIEPQEVFPSLKSYLEIIKLNSLMITNDHYDIIKCQLYCMIKSLIESYAGSMHSEFKYFKKNNEYILIETVKKYIIDNISKNFSTTEIAQQFNISERQLRRICKSNLNMTIFDLKKQIQIKYISSLLAETDLSLKEIAAKTGYSDEYTLGKFFKKNGGMSPGEFRKSSKK